MSQTKIEADTGQLAAVKVEPERAHHWLRKLVGEWTYETDAPAEAGQAPAKVTGTESVRALGAIWVLAEGKGEMPGAGPVTTLMTLGYDPARKRFVGTWIGSMMTHLWIYDGELDRDERVLTLNSEGPGMSGDGTTAQYRDVIEFKSDDHRVLTAFVRGNDGTWQSFMTADYRRATGRG